MGHRRTARECDSHPLRQVAAVLSVALASSCGATDSGSEGASKTSGATSGTSAGIESVADLFSRFASLICERACPTELNLATLGFAGTCEQNYSLFYEALAAGVQRGITKGSVIFDNLVAKQCLDDFAKSECGVVSLPSCDLVFVGTIPNGGACTDTQECAGDAHCQLDSCPGTCQANPTMGQSCLDSARCGADLACNADNVCDLPLANGEPCQTGDNCASGYCRSVDGVRTCDDLTEYFSLARDAPCDGLFTCQKGLYCPITLGEAPVCTPVANLGQACTSLPYDTACVDGAYCATTSGDASGAGTCVAQTALGGTCTQARECMTGVCDGGTCQPRSALGGPCVTDARCVGVCVNGACQLAPECPEQE